MATGLITNSGKQIMLERTYTVTPTKSVVSKFKVGIGTTDPTLNDTDLGHAIPIGGTEEVDNCDTADWSDSTDCTSSLNTTTFKEGTSSLNITKDGTAGVFCDVIKTTTSRDFTDKELSVWVYIKDQTTLDKLRTSDYSFQILFGSDSSNFYYWNTYISDLSIGWNLIDGMNVSNINGSSGTPVLTACDYTFVRFSTNNSSDVWSEGDVAIDDIKLISSDNYIKSFETGYPAIDLNNIEATVRCRINTLEANGYPLTEVGIFNEDGTPLMESRDTFSQVSKSDVDEIVFITKSRIE